jgi:hypothetical protein
VYGRNEGYDKLEKMEEIKKTDKLAFSIEKYVS